MIGVALLIVLGGPAENICTIEGRLKLLKGDQPISPAGLAVVYVEKGPEALEDEVSEPREHTILQINKQFSPRVLVINKEDQVTFVNKDKGVLHSVFSRADFDPFEFDATGKPDTGHRSFMWTGPMMVQCDRHRNMRADVLVLQTRHWAHPGEDGRFRLTGLPSGRYTLTAWEPNNAVQTITVKSCRGTVDVGTTTLKVGPEPKRVRKDGSEKWPDYQD